MTTTDDDNDYSPWPIIDNERKAYSAAYLINELTMKHLRAFVIFHLGGYRNIISVSKAQAREMLRDLTGDQETVQAAIDGNYIYLFDERGE